MRLLAFQAHLNSAKIGAMPLPSGTWPRPRPPTPIFRAWPWPKHARGCIGRCFTAARVDGTDLLTPDQLDIIGRSLILRGEYIALVTADGYLGSSWQPPTFSAPVPTRWNGVTAASTTHRGVEADTVVAPADSLFLHVRTGASRSAPWRGRSPLLGAMSDVELTMTAARSLQGEASVKTHEYIAPPGDNPASRFVGGSSEHLDRPH